MKTTLGLIVFPCIGLQMIRCETRDSRKDSSGGINRIGTWYGIELDTYHATDIALSFTDVEANWGQIKSVYPRNRD
jgi:hypothetical protein